MKETWEQKVDREIAETEAKIDGDSRNLWLAVTIWVVTIVSVVLLAVVPLDQIQRLARPIMELIGACLVLAFIIWFIVTLNKIARK